MHSLSICDIEARPLRAVFHFVCCFQIVAGSASAALLRYEFSGVLPAGASDHSEVSDGEAWIANFDVDTTITDTDPEESKGGYKDSAVAGRIRFSGGYEFEFKEVPFNTIVFNDSYDGNSTVEYIDGVSIRDRPFPSQFGVQAQVESFIPPIALLPDVELPGVGTAFTSVGNGEPYFQLIFSEVDKGRIEYDASDAVNVTFRALTIPEPTTLALFAIGCAAIGCRRRR